MYAVTSRRTWVPVRSRREFEHVLVVGAGQMGAGIAQDLRRVRPHRFLHDPFPGAIERGLARMEQEPQKLAEKGAEHDPDEVLARVEPVDELADADLMVEAVIEDPEAKTDIFRRADEALGPSTRSSPRTRRRSRSPRSPGSPAGRTA